MVTKNRKKLLKILNTITQFVQVSSTSVQLMFSEEDPLTSVWTDPVKDFTFVAEIIKDAKNPAMALGSASNHEAERQAQKCTTLRANNQRRTPLLSVSCCLDLHKAFD